MQEKRTLIQTIRDRQKNWVGHVLRSDSLLRTVYMGSTMTEDCESHSEISVRVVPRKEASKKNNELLRGKTKLSLKKRLIKTLIWSVVLYGSETWTISERGYYKIGSI